MATGEGDRPPSGSIPDDEGPISLNTVRLALMALKERCQRQEQRIQELEEEKETIRNSR